MRNRFLVILGACALALAGLYAQSNMPVDAIPDLSENQVIVFTDWPGRSPREVEDQVTYPLSVNLQGLAGVKVIRSSSEFNFSMINIIFDEKIDFYFARQRVLERLSLAGGFLPSGVTPYLAPDATALGQIFWYTVEGENRDKGELRAIQDWYVRYQLNSVPGVAEVASVGGAPREYQIDLDPTTLRAYGITLGEVYEAVSRSNASIGGRVIQLGNAEYLIRALGWVASLDDLRKTVVALRDGVPVTLGALAVVQFGPGYQRGILEKDGSEVVGGVVLMRHGENPREITQRIRDKLRDLQHGLPPGVRVVPFYDRTPLIDGAMDNIRHIVLEEIVICALAIILILGHFRSALVITVSLPLAVLASFVMMGVWGVPSNIMSMAGIAISVGILVDQSIVMTENAAHHLTRHFGDQPIRGDITAIVLPACQTVGRPIFFSVMITILSFLPVFALSGMEGKMFHPLAYTKTFALVAVALLSITLTPALIPIFLKGRIRSEEQNWLVRSMIRIYRPMLSALMDRPGLVIWLFVCILGLGGVAASRLGREFMPRLREGTLLEMPASVPRMSVTQAASDLKMRDAVLQSFPEVLLAVGKAGRAETATDPAPLDMIETIVNLRPREHWPLRKLHYDDALKITRQMLDALESAGLATPPTAEDRETLVNDAAMAVIGELDDVLRRQSHQAMQGALPDISKGIIRTVIDHVADGRDPERAAGFADEMRVKLTEQLAAQYGAYFFRGVERDDVQRLIDEVRRRTDGDADSGEALGKRALTRHGLADDGSVWSRFVAAAGSPFGVGAVAPLDRLTALLAQRHEQALASFRHDYDGQLYATAVDFLPAAAMRAIRKTMADTAAAASKGISTEEALPLAWTALAEELGAKLDKRFLLWRATQQDLEEELNIALQMPGWGNIFTQPIINRIDMLSTGVRTQIGVKVFGDDLEKIQKVGQDVARALKTVRGAVDVVPDQIVGKGYLEILIDREKSARYGVRVGDIQDVVEVALGGKTIGMTVEGRQRFPIRMRYARAFREDEDAVKNVLVPVRGSTATPTDTVPDKAGDKPPIPRTKEIPADAPAQVTLSMVADIRIVEGPSVIKSENGLLRSYVQLNVRDRDALGFVEEAQRTVAEQVELPPGTYLEWAGEFEHQIHARRTLSVVFPVVAALIVLLLYLTYGRWMEPILVMTSVLGALAGGAMFQWLLDVPFSVAVQVGYIACFGMAVETGVVMLVYLRESVQDRGGLVGIRDIPELRRAVLDGAVHRLRPKLLTEGTAIIALAPMLWSTGVGAEMIRPMAAPVLGGLLIADEVIDVFLPVLFFQCERFRWRRLRGLRWYDPDDAPPRVRIGGPDRVNPTRVEQIGVNPSLPACEDRESALSRTLLGAPTHDSGGGVMANS